MNKVWVWVGFPMGIGVLLLLLVFMGGGEPSSSSSAANGLKIEDVQVGDGPAVKRGDMVAVHYIGKLKDGTVFDTSFKQKPPQPLEFTVGEGKVIKGWDQGLIGMKVGGHRKLIIPPELAYGKRGRPGIPPNSELHFDIQLLAIE